MERTRLAKRIMDLVQDTSSWGIKPIGYDAGFLNESDYAPYRRFKGDEKHVALFYHDSPRKNPYKPKPKPDQRLRVQAKQIEELKKLRHVYGLDHDAAWLRKEIHLKVTYPGCTYDGIIDYDHNLDALLPEWYEKLPVMSWDGLEKAEHAPDGADEPEIMNAREITKEYIEVPDALLEHVRAAWLERLLPYNVRVEPYKIFIYGPGGRLHSHHEAPEEGLVGTFLLGLGYTASFEAFGGCLRVGPDPRDSQHTKGGRWTASYSHVYRRITPWETGYQAVLAFKVFRLDDGTGPRAAPNLPTDGSRDTYALERNGRGKDGDAYAEALPPFLVPDALATIQAILVKASLPLGILLSHQYTEGIVEPKGFDALVYRAAKNLPDTQLRLVPVLENEKAVRQLTTDYDEERISNAVADIFPFGDAQLDFLLQKTDEAALSADDLGAWAVEFHHIPFYNLYTNPSSISHPIPGEVLYHAKNQSYTRSETRTYAEHNVFMAYAFVILPSTPEADTELAEATEDLATGKSDQEEDEDSDDDDEDEHDGDEDEFDEDEASEEESESDDEPEGAANPRKRTTENEVKSAKRTRLAQEV